MAIETSLEPIVSRRSLCRLAGRGAAALLCVLPAGAALAASQVLVVSGIGGEAEFETRFAEWSQKVATASASITGDPKRVVRLSGAGARRDAVLAAMKTATDSLVAGDQFTLVLLGHGTFDGTEYRFNLPGDDITGTELLAALDRMPSTVPQLVVNATSTSGAVADKWAKPHRLVITSTKSGGQRNAPKFGGFWADALSSSEADLDKDGTLTAKEAYEYATRKVADAYKADAAIATENARIGGAEPARFVVARIGVAAMFASDAQLSEMRGQQGVITGRLAELRALKGQLSQDEYYNRIEPVLVEMARVGERIDARFKALGVNVEESANANP